MNRSSPTGIFWWSMVGIYTIMLPWAILVWDEIALHLGTDAAALVPLLLAATLVVAAVGWLFWLRPGWRQWSYLLAASSIGAGILQHAELPAKGIHLPEYILMAVLVEQALKTSGRSGYQPAWTLAICLLLGVMDELMQGLIPTRFFSYQDITVNGLASLAGILGLRSLGVSAGYSCPVHFRFVPVFLFLMPLGLLSLILISIQGNLWAGLDGLAGLAAWQATALLLWVAVSFGWAYRQGADWPATGPRVVFLTASAALALLACGVLLNMPFV